MRKVIETKKAPSAIGPYSQAISLEKLVFVSGQLPVDMKNGNFPEEIKSQTKASIENMKNILEAAGSNIDKVLKTTVFLSNMNNFSEMNEVYATYFKEKTPARSTVEVAKLPKNALVEIECIAYI